MPDFEILKDRTAELPGSGAAGTNASPLLAGTVRSRVFLLMNKRTLPMYHRSGKKPGMTQLLFQDALLNCSANKTDKGQLGKYSF